MNHITNYKNYMTDDMISQDDKKYNSKNSSVSERLKARREVLGISQEKMAKDIGISVAQIERYENQKPQEIKTYDTIETSEPEKYIVEIYKNKEDRIKGRELDLFPFEGINLLFEQVESIKGYVIEFSARINPSGIVEYDTHDKISYEDPTNILEIINIRKVEKNAK